MLRNIVRRITPLANNVYKTATAPQHIMKHAVFSSSRLLSGNRFSTRYYSQQENTENLPVVDFDYVKRATSQNNVIIIDVREPDEIIEFGKIPNSINIPWGNLSTTLELSEKDFQQTFNRAKPKGNTEMIFYCMVGKRSGKAQQIAVNMGFNNSKNYLGSWTDWAVKTQ